MGNSGRIRVELPGAKDVARVKNLLQSTAQLEFWYTEKNDDFLPFLSKANEVLRVSVVNALSDHLTARVFRDGKTWIQEYSKGKALFPVKQDGDSSKSGTEVTFRPDKSIFKDKIFDCFDSLHQSS